MQPTHTNPGQARAKPRITVFFTGGTIASVRHADEAATPTLTAEQLVSAMPQLGEIAEITPVQFRQVPSSELSLRDIINLAIDVGQAVANGADGIVITQGTDTLEETSFALSLLYGGRAPVVMTGAMRDPGLPSADGPGNLFDAVLLASSQAAHGLGALVVFNGEIHLPLFVRKAHTSNLAAFRSLQTGPIGWISENRPSLALRPAFRHHISIQNIPSTIPPVCLLTVTLGDDGRILPALASFGYQGLVVEALGGGHTAPVMVEPLAELSRTMPIILSSRTGSGEVLRDSYGFPGSETDLLKRGLLHAGILDGPKSRVLLTLLLLTNAPRNVIADAFFAVGSFKAPQRGGIKVLPQA